MESPGPKPANNVRASAYQGALRDKTKFVVYGEEVIEKKVAVSGASGRIYLPLGWLGKSVKIIRMD